MVVVNSKYSENTDDEAASPVRAALPFARLFDLHKKSVFSLCMRITGDVTRAEAVMETSFLQAFRRSAQMPAEPSFSGWLCEAARRNLFSPGALATWQSQNLEPALQPSRRKSAVRAIARDEMVRCIKHLSSPRRAIFVLHEIEGLTHCEIARLLHCSEAHSKAELHQARLQVRQSLLIDRPVDNPISAGCKRHHVFDRAAYLQFPATHEKDATRADVPGSAYGRHTLSSCAYDLHWKLQLEPFSSSLLNHVLNLDPFH